MKKVIFVALFMIGTLELFAQTSDGLAASHHVKKAEVAPYEHVNIFYNYVSKALDITQPDPSGWLTVQRITGHVVLNQQIHGFQSEVSLESFHSGIYVYKLITSTGKSVKGKFEIR